MGLDGISVNSLRITPENTSKENAINADATAKNQGSRSVNSLDKKGAIDTDDKENTSFFGGESSNGESEEENEIIEDIIPVEKIDLTNKEDYEIRVEGTNNIISIYNKKSESVVQQITPTELSELVDSLKNPGGIIINKRI